MTLLKAVHRLTFNPAARIPLRRSVSCLLGLTTAVVTMASPAQAIPLGELLLRGIQILQVSNISERQEVKIGAQMHQNLLRKGTRLSTDPVLNRYVTDIGQRLVTTGQRRNIPYQFFVVRDPAVNAFATMGGHVYVTTGLIQAADNEAQLASVMAHEVGHIEKKHLLDQIQQAMVARGLVATALGVEQNQFANIGIELLLSRPQSREDEFQADQVGLSILREADYATSAMPAFMRKLLQADRGGGGPRFLSTHPAVADRVKALESAIRTGPTNACDEDSRADRCGLDSEAYASEVKTRV